MSSAVTAIISHRCRGFGLPENRAAALRAALQSEVDGIELDIRQSSDGGLFAAHLPIFAVSTLRHHLIRRLSAPFLAECGAMSLVEALDILNDARRDVRLLLDVKVPGAEAQVIHLLEKAGWLDRCSIMSVSPIILKAFSVKEPSLRLNHSILVPGFGAGVDTAFANRRIASGERIVGSVERVTVVPVGGVVAESLVRTLAERYEVMVVAKTGEEMQRFEAAGAKKILTSNPRGLIEFRRQKLGRVLPDAPVPPR